ncbi:MULTISPECIES: hypothetical protein [unclassified Oceanispirochaeta]|uniref:hypothetical protein n=1 Tax=unclassified Oceanispirochaeta TaxID=2635722 RepID=UPI000E09BF1C|nr:MULTISPECIES: hypothetical protein [unclassified Oceanispirochaeta]MBF9017956.1 hypothetical protein [Oceanispirochaeta sp. M2]NPD74467.1 hypothetical protein [Oceanispirochaeta sp. M1]RDG29676.1 hypothetical protein DV872_20400 [Oceanispirochaeta sp. M1]
MTHGTEILQTTAQIGDAGLAIVEQTPFYFECWMTKRTDHHGENSSMDITNYFFFSKGYECNSGLI